MFNLVTSVKGTSHLDGEEYLSLITKACKRLRAGGMLIDDGIRRSYTLELRWDEVHRLEKTLGDEYRVSIIQESR